VTRDRLVETVRRPDLGLAFDLMDTGGLGIVDRDDLAASVEFQVLTGAHAADLLLLLVDSREGRTLLDDEAARLLRRADVPVLLLANKCENREAERGLSDFDALGFGAAVPLSAQDGRGVPEVWKALIERLPEAPEGEEQERVRIAVLGRRNTGKSSFVNALLGEERVIVSEIAGTTRDSVDVDFDWQGEPLTLVDTAGVHRRGKVADSVEFYSLTRSDQAIRRAELALLFLDLTQPIARLDQELARTVRDRHKPCLVVGTKADLAPEIGLAEFRDLVEHKLPHVKDAPLVLLSNVTGKGRDRVVREAVALAGRARTRVGTGALNRAMEASMRTLRFRGRGEKPKVMYATQLGVSPPTLLLFVNRKPLFTKEAMRAIEGDLRKRLDYQAVPLRLVLRERERSPSKRG
jgi:GTP-binding protein